MGNCMGSKTAKATGGASGAGTQYVDHQGGKAANVATSKQGVKQLKKQYEIREKALGKGTFGKVYMGQDKKDSSHKVAIKVLNKSKMSDEDLKSIMDEVKVLLTLDHPNITKYFETYDDKQFLYLVMEYCPFGEIFDSQESFLKDDKGYTEADAAKIISKCLEALQHCHSLGITHRDIKPENIMYGKDREVRIVDFGLSKDSKEKMQTYAGTPYFMAPEVIKGEYGHKCDIWSLGCVLYMLIAGKLPFEGYSKPEVFGKISKGVYQEPKCSELCADLIRQMLTVKADQRPTALECYKHAWLESVRKDED